MIEPTKLQSDYESQSICAFYVCAWPQSRSPDKLIIFCWNPKRKTSTCTIRAKTTMQLAIEVVCMKQH